MIMNVTQDFAEDEVTRPMPREGVVDDNPALSYLQCKAEEEKAELTRELHDNLGGLMVAAMMDTVWIQAHWDDAPQSQRRLNRVRDALAAAIDLKRNLIEALRPTLLDNFGLFAALKWHFKHWCAASGLTCHLNLAEREPTLLPATSIALFRFVQESLDLVKDHAHASSVSLALESCPTAMTISLAHDGGFDEAFLQSEVRFVALRHRIEQLRGVLRVEDSALRTSFLIAWIPLP
jgi:signal transduction histidine kinase